MTNILHTPYILTSRDDKDLAELFCVHSLVILWNNRHEYDQNNGTLVEEQIKTSGGSRISRGGGAEARQPIICKMFAENYVKMKEFGRGAFLHSALPWIRQWKESKM